MILLNRFGFSLVAVMTLALGQSCENSEGLVTCEPACTGGLQCVAGECQCGVTGGPCDSPTPFCVANACQTTKALDTAYRHVFVTSETGPIGTEFSSVTDADQFCQSKGIQSFPASTHWMAILASSAQSAEARVHARLDDGAADTKDLYLVDDETKVSGPFDASGTGHKLDVSIDQNELGETTVGRVWTGAEHTAVVGTQASTCAGWSDSGESGVISGYASSTALEWFKLTDSEPAVSTGQCNQSFHLYCIEVDKN